MRIITTLEGDGMVVQLVLYSIYSLVEFALEYIFVAAVDFPNKYDSGKSNDCECVNNPTKPPITRKTVVLRCISGIYTGISIVLAVLIYVFFGEGPFSTCIFVETFIHLLFGCTVSILRRKYDKEPHNYKKSKWL